MAVLEGTPHMRQFRIVQHSREHIELLVVPDAGFGEQQQEHIGKGLRALLGDDLRLTFSMQTEIPCTASGKHTAYIGLAT